MTTTSAPSTMPSTNQRNFWRELLACPGCRAPLPDPSACSQCGLVFTSEDGTPRLISSQLSRRIEINFTQERSSPSADRIAQWVCDPPHNEQRSGLPYHMEPAHAHVVEQFTPGMRVLEIGCGGGQCRPWFVDRSLEYIGVDVSKTRVFEWLRKFGGPDLLCDCHFLPFKDQSMDAVYCAAVLEHIACPPAVMQEVFRVLKPGGVFLGNVSFLEPWHDNSFFHMTPLGVAELLQQAGFDIQNIWPGKNYNGFYALWRMGFRPPLRVMKYFGQLGYWIYRLQANSLNTARKLAGRPTLRDIMIRAKVAGAVDWIAYRRQASI